MNNKDLNELEKVEQTIKELKIITDFDKGDLNQNLTEEQLKAQEELIKKFESLKNRLEDSTVQFKKAMDERDKEIARYYNQISDKVENFKELDCSKVQTALILDIIKSVGEILKDNNADGLEILYGSYSDRQKLIIEWIMTNYHKDKINLQEISNIVYSIMQNQVNLYSDVDLETFLSELKISDELKKELKQLLAYSLQPDLNFIKAFEQVINLVINGFIYNEQSERYESVGNNRKFLVLISRLTKISVEQLENLDVASLYSLLEYILMSLQKARVASFFQKTIETIFKIK